MLSHVIRMMLTVNERAVSVDPEPGRTLLEVLREDLALTGTKYGCGEGACGACTVLLDGTPIFSCTTPASEAEGKSIVTIEGLARGETLHPAQQAFLDDEAFQCGHCTPGMILATVALLERAPRPSDPQIREALNGHLCRCCGYTRIVSAVQRAAHATGGNRDANR